MYKTFTLPLKSAFALVALFILTACGGFTLDLNLPTNSDCIANPFESECGEEYASFRQLIIDDCANNPEKSDTSLCIAAINSLGAPDAPALDESCEDNPFAEGCGAVGEVAEITPKDTLIKSEFDKDGLAQTDGEKVRIATLEIVDLCTNPATAHDKQCTPAVVDCINNPFSGSCQGDNVLGNFVRGGVTLSKTVVLQDKRAEDCRTGSIDRALCQNLSVQKQRCAGAAFSTDEICTSVAYSVCKADAFDPLCGEKEDFHGVYFNQRSEVCFEDSNNPHCTGRNGHIAVVCSEYPFDRLCTGNTDYDVARANACESDPTVSASCPAAEVPEFVDVCLDNPFGPTCADSDYNNARKELVKTCAIQAVTGAVTTACDTIIDSVGACFIDPFSTACDGNHHAVKNYIGQLRSSRVALCESSAGGLAAWIAPLCASVPDTTPVGEITTVAPVVPATPQVTASVWADSFTAPLATEAAFDHLYNTESQFLIGRETDLDSGDVPSNIIRTSGNLNLADATFNGVALGGDRADGLAFLTDGALYAGILSGTNLGAPLTDTIGTAKWIGSFQLAGYSPTDFVLNVSFGAGSGAGEIEALIQSYVYFSDHHIKGEFDDAGVITGTADTGFYRRNDPTNRREDVGNHYHPGKLTGLIGEEGAVGAFIIDNLYGVGGFVARPSSSEELQTLAQTCADDPFNTLCTIGYESERNAVLDHCIIGGNANDESCRSANNLDSCIKHPFRSSCEARLPDHYEQVRVNRLAFCRTEGNAGNELCTSRTTFAHICTNYPFDAQCLGDSDYDFARQNACDVAGAGSTECRTLTGITCGNNPFDARCGGAYNNARESACTSNPGQSRCRDTVARVCNGNPFDSLCRNTTVYLNARKTHCRSTSNDQRCGATIRAVCALDPFDRMCNSVYDRPRETACRNGSASTWQCRTTVAGICGNNPFDTLCGSGYTQNRRSLCTDNPFAPRCAGEGYNDLRVSFCVGKVGNHPSCPAPEPTTPQVTATVWADSFDEDLAHGVTADDTESQFLIGRATDLDDGGRRPYRTRSGYNDGLNLADATFKGVALGGDAADGVAFFAAERANNGWAYSYAGILEGTNLGAPLTDTIGTAKWVGSVRYEGYSAQDFVLNISFGAGDGAGEIEALVQTRRSYNLHIAGEFDDTGVITGWVRSGYLGPNDPNNSASYIHAEGKLTGLIGEEGAVGAFLLRNTFGGFVARPSSTDELRTLEQTCADDPFNKFCALGYESERNEIIEYCITGGNARDSRCSPVINAYACVYDPFYSSCDAILPNHYERARANRVAFCRTEGNADNRLCTITETFAHICTNYPFDAQCLGDSDYDFARQNACDTAGAGSIECRTLVELNCGANPFHSYCDSGYNDARAVACITNPGQQRCADTLERVCSGNPFDTLCRNTTIYLNARKTQCRSNWNDQRCGATISAVCGVNPFDRMCNSVYDLPREIACRAGTATLQQCGTTVAGICSGNPFDTLCGSGYTQNRRSLCSGNPFAPRCAGDVYNDLRVSFCEDNAGTHSSCPAPEQHPAGHVTGTVWTDSFDEGELAVKASRTDTVSKFLKGRAGDLDTGGIRVLASGNANYSGTLTFDDGLFFHGDAADGVAFFAAEKVNGRFLSYAGILSGTDLGGPVTETEGSAEWLGSFQFEGYSATDFTLNVVFGGGDEAGLINAIIQDYTNNDFHVAGSFDDAGVITGNVYLGTFRVNQDPISHGIVKHTAELTGLIGQQGAVGAFVGHSSSTTGFAGGFIAAEDGEGYTVRTANWLASFDTEPLSIPTDSESQFLKATATGFNMAEMPGVSTHGQYLDVLTLADNFADGASLGGHGADGVAFFGRRVDGYYRHYAGILANTDLGLPLEPENTPTYEWKGVFQAVGSSSLKTDFTLKVTYTGGHYAGTVEAFINKRSNYYYHIKGNFSHSSLILSGTVDYGQYTDGNRNDPIARGRRTGVLKGLIGQEGVIGAFIADSYSASGYYSGGFVAASNFVDVTPPDPSPNRVTTADWLASFDPPLSTQISTRARFFDSSQAGTGNSYDLTSFAEATFDGQSLGGDASGGVYTFKTTGGTYNSTDTYASIHPDTDLGAHLSAAAGTKMIWHGAFTTQKDHFLSTGVHVPITQDFDLEINFGAGNKVGTVEAFVKRIGSAYEDAYYHLKGEFGVTGVIDGTVNSGIFPDHDPLGRVSDGTPYFLHRQSVLSGLIGEKGAVGAFHMGFIPGRFVATPTAIFDSNVKYSDWTNSFDAGELQNFVSRYKVDSLSYFVQANENGLMINNRSGLVSITRGDRQTLTDTKLNLSDINPNLDSRDGLSYMDTMWSPFAAAGYTAGILSSTDLGLSLVARPADAQGRPQKATWGGKLGLISDDTPSPTRNIGLVVDFTNQTIHNTSSINGAHKIVLNGSWTNSADNSQNGVINGDITYAIKPGSTADVGVVKGLIGQEGAVGVFVSYGYTGGFVAHPSAVFVPEPNRVTTVNWLASFGVEPPKVGYANHNNFVRNPGAFLNVRRVGSVEGNRLTLDDDIFTDGGGDATDGVMFYKADNRAGTKSYFYAGILSSTELGAPLTQTSGTATWSGRFHAVLSGSVLSEFSRDFTLDITFNATGGDISTVVSGRTEDYFELEGTFTRQGVISGTANHVYYENGRIGDVTGDIVNSGPVTGLIGQEGAVGAFISERQSGNTGGFAGGFVARPPSE